MFDLLILIYLPKIEWIGRCCPAASETLIDCYYLELNHKDPLRHTCYTACCYAGGRWSTNAIHGTVNRCLEICVGVRKLAH